jgi:hypothetical protein
MMAFQLVTIVGLTVMTAVGMLAASALSWMAWLTVLTLLHIQGSDTFLALKNVDYLVSSRGCHSVTFRFIDTAALKVDVQQILLHVWHLC